MALSAAMLPGNVEVTIFDLGRFDRSNDAHWRRKHDFG